MLVGMVWEKSLIECLVRVPVEVIGVSLRPRFLVLDGHMVAIVLIIMRHHLIVLCFDSVDPGIVKGRRRVATFT